MFLREGLNLVHICQMSHFPTLAPNLTGTDSEKHGLYGHGSNIIVEYLLLYLISGWAQGHCGPKLRAHHSGLEFVCLQCIASGRRVPGSESGHWFLLCVTHMLGSRVVRGDKVLLLFGSGCLRSLDRAASETPVILCSGPQLLRCIGPCCVGPHASLPGPLKSHLMPPIISVSFSVTMMKYSDKGSGAGEGLV